MRPAVLFSALLSAFVIGALAAFGGATSTAGSGSTEISTFTPTGTPIETPSPNTGFVVGDFNCDYAVDLDDAVIGLESLATQADTTTGTACNPNGDLDCDTDFDGVDVLAIVRFTAELPLTFPGCTAVGDIQFELSTECANLDQPFEIPDGGNATLQFQFPESAQILGLALCVDIDHPSIGDLVLTLTHDETTTAVTLADRTGNPPHAGNCTGHGEGLIVLFADSGDETMQEHCTNTATAEFLDLVFAPEEPLSAFNQEDVHGTWTVTVGDAHTGNTGTILGATFTYIYQPEGSALSARRAAQRPIQ